jgi:hypothetical protein
MICHRELTAADVDHLVADAQNISTTPIIEDVL